MRNPFGSILGKYYDDKIDVNERGEIWCVYHQEHYKAVETGNKCFKKYKNCPKCNAETNYRIELKKHYDSVAYNQWALFYNQPTMPLVVKPRPPEWWVDTHEKSEFYPSKIVKPNRQVIEAMEYEPPEMPVSAMRYERSDKYHPKKPLTMAFYYDEMESKADERYDEQNPF